jgi:PBP1b-binding outer membrane lipoprotein LpoB
MKRLITLVLCSFLLSGCQGSAPTAQQASEPIASVPQPKAEITASPKPVSEEESAKKFLEAYFDAAINQGSDGSDRWCSQAGSLQQSLISPRTYKILGVTKQGTKDSPSYRFQTTVESSNEGGSPIANNWGFYVMKDDKDTTQWCLGLIARS